MQKWQRLVRIRVRWQPTKNPGAGALPHGGVKLAPPQGLAAWASGLEVAFGDERPPNDPQSIWGRGDLAKANCPFGRLLVGSAGPRYPRRDQGGALELADFQPERFIYEVRYARAWLMWDRAGAMARALQKEFPGLEATEGAPAKVALTLPPNVQISFEPEKSAVVVHGPKRTGEDLTLYARVLTAALIEQFEIVSFTRVATRMLFERSYDTLEQATARLMAFKMLQPTESRVFNQTAPLKQIDYRYRWEGAATGVLLRFASETEKLDFNPGPQVAEEIKPISREKHRILLDVDYFSTVHILKEQLRVEDWIKNALHMVHRDTKPFMREH